MAWGLRWRADQGIMRDGSHQRFRPAGRASRDRRPGSRRRPVPHEDPPAAATADSPPFDGRRAWSWRSSPG